MLRSDRWEDHSFGRTLTYVKTPIELLNRIVFQPNFHYVAGFPGTNSFECFKFPKQLSELVFMAHQKQNLSLEII